MKFSYQIVSKPVCKELLIHSEDGDNYIKYKLKPEGYIISGLSEEMLYLCSREMIDRTYKTEDDIKKFVIRLNLA